MEITGFALPLCRAIPRLGICAADVSGELARHRSLPLCGQAAKLYHMGIRSPVRRATLADANERRDWRIYATLHSA